MNKQEQNKHDKLCRFCRDGVLNIVNANLLCPVIDEVDMRATLPCYSFRADWPVMKNLHKYFPKDFGTIHEDVTTNR